MNQLESGTSSMVLTFCARMSGADRPAREQVQPQIERERDVPRLHARGVARFRLARDRIVVVELRRSGVDARPREHERSHGDRQAIRIRQRLRCIQPLSRSDMSRLERRVRARRRVATPSRPCASLDAQRRGGRACETVRRCPSWSSIVEAQSRRSRSDRPGVVEQRHVQAETVWNPAPLGRASASRADRGTASCCSRAACCRCRATAAESTAPGRRRRASAAAARAARRPSSRAGSACAARC